VIAEGARFPDCPKHPKLPTTWKSDADEPIRHAKELWNNQKKRPDTAA
jgi:hypothetical protein